MKKSIIILLAFVLTCSLFPSARAADTAHAAAPIDPLAYQQMLGKGMDVDWCKTAAGMCRFTTRMSPKTLSRPEYLMSVFG